MTGLGISIMIVVLLTVWVRSWSLCRHGRQLYCPDCDREI